MKNYSVVLVPIVLSALSCIGYAQSAQSTSDNLLAPKETIEDLKPENKPVEPLPEFKEIDPTVESAGTEKSKVKDQEKKPTEDLQSKEDSADNDDAESDSDVVEEKAPTPKPVAKKLPAKALPSKAKSKHSVVEKKVKLPSKPVVSKKEKPVVTARVVSTRKMSPDEIEKQFHRNFEVQKKITGQEWDQVVGNRKAEEYEIQSGDTLWDISETLFGEGSYWPKIWSMNTGIENPHEINSKNKIIFYPGDLSHAPGVEVTPKDVPNGMLLGEIKSKEFLDQLPDSLPPWKMIRPEVVSSVQLAPYKTPQIVNVRDLPFFVVNQLPEYLGEIIEVEGGYSTAGPMMQVYVKSSSPLKNGDVLTVMTESKDPLAMPNVHALVYQGELEVLGPVVGSDEAYKAKVVRSLLPVEMHAKFIAGKIPTYNLNEAGTPGAAELKIMRGAAGNGLLLRATDAIVFVDGGRNQNVSVNQVFAIYADAKNRNPKSLVETEGKIGEIKIVNVSDDVSTAVVLWAKSEIRNGDKTFEVAPKLAVVDSAVQEPAKEEKKIEADQGAEAPPPEAAEPSEVVP